jgi:hypothetical protein
VFSVLFVSRSYLEENGATQSEIERERPTRVEAGSNTSIVTLRVVGGDEKESFKYETVKYGREPQKNKTVTVKQ